MRMPVKPHRRWRPFVRALLLLLPAVAPAAFAQAPQAPVQGLPEAIDSRPLPLSAPAPVPALNLAEARSEDVRAGQVRFRTWAVAGSLVGAVAAYGSAKWWQDGLVGEFKTVDEGWFGTQTTSGGIDKIGHAMGGYASTRLLANAFEAAGNPPGKARELALWTGLGTMMGIEIVDGFSTKWRFSKEDAIANLAGGALAYWLDSSPAADALIDLRIQYSPSTGPAGRHRFDPFGDYSGQRYLFVVKASGVPALQGHAWLRYLEFGVGYGARNFEPTSRTQLTPTRNVYYGVSVNLAEFLRGTVWAGASSRSRTQRATETFLEYVQIPALAVQGDHTLR